MAVPSPGSAMLLNIAKLTAEGLEPEQIRARTDLDVSFIRRVQAHPSFVETLREVSTDAADLWEEAQSARFARRRVKAAAREDAPEHYQMLRDLVRTSAELKDTEKAGILRDLIKFSGAVDEQVEEETIVLASSQLALIQETLREVSGADDLN